MTPVGATTRHRLNTRAMWALSLMLFILPFILGGNRPLAWTIYAMLLSILAAYYFAVLLINNMGPKISLSRLLMPSILLAVFCAYIVVQSLPVAASFSSLLYLPHGVVRPSTISISYHDTMLALARWVNIALTGFLSVQICANPSRARRFLVILFWIVAAHAAYGLLLRYEFDDTILFTKKWAYSGFVTGGFVNRNSFATFLAIGLILGVVHCYDFSRRAPPYGLRTVTKLFDVRDGILLPLLGCVLIAVAIFATGSRMGLVASVVGVVTAVVLLRGKPPVATSRYYSVFRQLAIFSVAAAIIAYFFGSSVIRRFDELDKSSQFRTQLYEQVWNMILTRPWTGFGGGTFEYAYPMFHDRPVNFDLTWDRAHSSYLALWSEYGFLFGTVPILLVAYLTLSFVATYRRNTKADTFTISALAATVTVAIHSLVDFSLEMHGVTLLYAALVAGAVGKGESIKNGVPVSD